MPLTSFPTSFSFHSISFCLPGTESCCRECTNSLAVREKSDKMNVCGALLCRMTCCKNTTVFWKVTLEMASWEWVGEGYVYYLLMTSRLSLLSLQVKGKKKKKKTTNKQKSEKVYYFKWSRREMDLKGNEPCRALGRLSRARMSTSWCHLPCVDAHGMSSVPLPPKLSPICGSAAGWAVLLCCRRALCVSLFHICTKCQNTRRKVASSNFFGARRGAF